MNAIQTLALLVAFVLLWKWCVRIGLWLVTVPILLLAVVLVRVPILWRLGGPVALAAVDFSLWLDGWVNGENGKGGE